MLVQARAPDGHESSKVDRDVIGRGGDARIRGSGPLSPTR